MKPAPSSLWIFPWILWLGLSAWNPPFDAFAQSSSTADSLHSSIPVLPSRHSSQPVSQPEPALKTADTPGDFYSTDIQVVTSEQIREAGITRLNDLFLLFDNWSSYTINGRDRIAAAGAHSLYSGNRWSVMIDHHPVPVTVLGMGSLNTLPITLQEIEEIHIIQTPMLYEGVAADQGLIHIHTVTEVPSNGDRSADPQRRVRPWSDSSKINLQRFGRATPPRDPPYASSNQPQGGYGNLRMATSNETGDPGPHEFTELNSPNLERSGPDLDITAGHRSSRWALHGSASMMRYRSSDPRIEQRVKEMLFTGTSFLEPTNERNTARLFGSYSGDRLRIQLQGGVTSYQDFPFFRPYGREIPVQFRNAYGGAGAVWRLAEPTHLRYNLTWHRMTPGASRNRDDFSFNFGINGLSQRLHLEQNSGTRKRFAGLVYDRRQASGAFSGNAVISTLQAQAGWSEHLSSQLRISAEAAIGTTAGDPETAVMGRIQWLFHDHQQIHLWLSHSLRPEAGSSDPDFWIQRGYEGLLPLQNGGLNRETEWLNREHQSGRNRLTRGGLRWNLALHDSFQLNLNGEVNRHHETGLERYPYEMSHPQQWFVHPGVQRFSGEQATVATVGFRITARSFPGVSHRISGRQQWILSGTSAVKSALEEIPPYRFNVLTRYTPLRGFQLLSHFHLTAATTWSEFRDAEGEEFTDQRQLAHYRFSHQTEPVPRLDLGGRKSLGDGLLNIALWVENLLNRSYLLHPAGADKHLTFTVQLEINL